MGTIKIVTGVTYGLLIAVENYNQDKKFKKVGYASKDAKDLLDAFLTLGYDKDDFHCLIDQNATYNSIISEIKHLSRRATKDDRIIVFFAGHGVYVNSENRILPVDAYAENLMETSLPIEIILGYLKKSDSRKNLLFLDCCHSGFEPGKIERDISSDFSVDQLLYDFRNEEYCCGFASCKSDEKSHTNQSLRNGVWTHFLIKALKGDGGDIYDNGILFSHKLQSYLKAEVPLFVKQNHLKKNQTPMIFGSQTDVFPIADLSFIFDERIRKQIENEEENRRKQKEAEITLFDVSLISEKEGQVKFLSGFQKGYHSIPNRSGADDFIKKCGSALIKDEIKKIGNELKEKMKYKRKEIDAWSEDGSGAINTPDFKYSVEIFQSAEDPANYVLVRKLEEFGLSDAICLFQRS
jgi:hypothetical protein